MPKTFKSRVFRNIIILVLIISCSFGLFYAHRQKALLEEELVVHGTSITEILAGNLRLGLITGSDEFLSEPIRATLEHPEVLQVAVYDDKSTLIKSDGKKQLADLRNSEEIVALLKETDSTIHLKGNNHSEFWSPILSTGSSPSYEDDFFPKPSGDQLPLGYVRVSISRSHVVSGTKSIIFGTIAMTILFILIGGIIAYYISSLITRPLSNFIYNIEDMEDGVKKIYMSGDAEIVKLGDAFNNMAEALNKREYEREKAYRELQELSAYILRVKEEERRLISREIHDELGQLLTALQMDISWVDKKMPPSNDLRNKLKSMLNLTTSAISTVQKISNELRPSVLDNLGLSEAIKWHALDFQNRSGIKCKVITKPQDIILGQSLSIDVYRIFQEILTNVARHAHASEVVVNLKINADMFELQVKDNGVGIEEEQIHNSKSFGIIGMRERVNYWGGSLNIMAAKNSGTNVTINIPLDKEHRK